MYSIEKCSKELRNELYDNIVLTGGTSLISGLAGRLESEINMYASKMGVSNVVEVYSDSHKEYASWIGASMLGTFSTFGQLKVDKAEYEENEAAIMKKVI